MAIDDGGAQAKATASTDADGVVVIAIAGELDISNVDDIERDCTDAVAPSSGSIVFDLADLSFMDSSGLAMLLRIAARVESTSIRRPSRAVQRILEATGLTGRFRIEP